MIPRFAKILVGPLLAAIPSILTAQEIVPFEMERQVLLKRENPQSKELWFHPRVAAIPGAGENGNPAVIMTLQKLLGKSDFFSGLSVMRSDDLGKTWTRPSAPKELGWIEEGDGVNIAVADVTPGWHAPSSKLIAIGAQVRYSPEGKQLQDRPRSHQTAYAIYDPKTDKWTGWKRIEMRKGKEFNFARSACAQWLVEEDGSCLLPFYIGEGTKTPFSSTMVRCSFDGETLEYREHGNILRHEVMRGLYEPSVIRFRGNYFLTMRNDQKAFVAVSEDGLQFSEPMPWTFDDGSELGSYNTQAHWLVKEDGLFLSYTRRGADNDHVVRHRAPLFLAQVDPEKLQVMRGTEKIVVPERGATLGNSGISQISGNESWITVAEGNVDRPEAKERKADGSVYLVRIR